MAKEKSVAQERFGSTHKGKTPDDVRVSTFLKSRSVSAQVDATLEVQMVEATNGASIWSTSASATTNVGNISVFGKEFAFDFDDPERAYGPLVNVLVERVTQDFHVTWRTQ